MYDIFFIGQDKIFKIYKKYFLTLKKASSISEAKDKSVTKFFWILWDNLIIKDDVILDFKINEHDEKYIHVFKNGKYFDGVILLSKDTLLSEKECNYRFFVNKKEIDIVASVPKDYESYTCKTYDDYLRAREISTTDFFYIIWDNLDVKFNFNYQVPYYEKDLVHVFKNKDYFDGIIIVHKDILLSKKEFEYRFFANKKEIDIVASLPKKYDKFVCNTYYDFLEAKQSCKTDFFYLINSDVIVNIELEQQVPYYEKDLVHVFKHGEYYDGISICHKDSRITEREFNYRFYLKNKKIEISASFPKQYDIITYKNYNDLMHKRDKVTTDFYYAISEDLDVKLNFSYQIPYNEKDLVHIFKNEKYFDGVICLNKNKQIYEKELEYKFFANKKEINFNISSPKKFDIVYISYFELNADENFQMLEERFKDYVIHRVENVKGIHNAHIAAAKKVNTNMFWVVDADAHIVHDFDFSYQVAKWDQDAVHVWRSSNPINGLVYGYGGVKLLPKKLTINMDLNSTDMTTSISSKFKLVDAISNITVFNTDPFSTWKSAFRECAKLASKVIDRQENEESEERLNIWCSDIGLDKKYGNYAKSGALLGREFGSKFKTDKDKLKLINDFQWLNEQFSKYTV